MNRVNDDCAVDNVVNNNQVINTIKESIADVIRFQISKITDVASRGIDDIAVSGVGAAVILAMGIEMSSSSSAIIIENLRSVNVKSMN